MYEDIFKQIGLDEKQTAVYTAMLELGPATVGQLLKKTPYKRGDLYNVVYSLRDKGLVSEKVSKGVTIFTLEEPEHIKDLITAEKERIARVQQGFDAIFPDLKSQYNLSVQKPGVRFYEGEEGMKTLMADSLSAKSEIYSYVDVEAVQAYVSEFNKEYVKDRERLGKKKKMIVFDSEYNRHYFAQLGTSVTDVRFIAYPFNSFGVGMQIYDKKISYLTMEPSHMIGVIIEDSLISNMHRQLFEYMWSTAISTGSPQNS
ncbi:MAG: helix-turn-helix domain-containing protein [bacterium]|nr:helix-turn-helix domain-containing protein [bacterium]